jgi:hypothetical protein
MVKRRAIKTHQSGQIDIMSRKLTRVNENEHANLQSDLDDVLTRDLYRGPLKDKYGILPLDQPILLSQPHPPIQPTNPSSSIALSNYNIKNEAQ